MSKRVYFIFSDTYFKPRKTYQYDYTAVTSSAFVGVSDSRSATKVTCTLTIEVPRRCEAVLQVN